MSLLSYFRMTLTCSSCDEPGVAWIDHKLGNKGATYEVGDRPGNDIQRVDFDDTAFLVAEPVGEAIRILLPWTCSLCRAGNWAVVTLAGGRVESIDAVALESATLDRVDFVSRRIDEDFEELVGESIWTDEGLRPDWLPRLRAVLS